MLYSTHRSDFSDNDVSNSMSPRYGAVKQRGIRLRYYVLPEDTTDREDEWHSWTRRYKKTDFYSMAKAGLWIAVSIGLSLLIGNLD
jgi:hypothetical protein